MEWVDWKREHTVRVELFKVEEAFLNSNPSPKHFISKASSTLRKVGIKTLMK